VNIYLIMMLLLKSGRIVSGFWFISQVKLVIFIKVTLTTKKRKGKKKKKLTKLSRIVIFSFQHGQ